MTPGESGPAMDQITDLNDREVRRQGQRVGVRAEGHQRPPELFGVPTDVPEDRDAAAGGKASPGVLTQEVHHTVTPKPCTARGTSDGARAARCTAWIGSGE